MQTISIVSSERSGDRLDRSEFDQPDQPNQINQAMHFLRTGQDSQHCGNICTNILRKNFHSFQPPSFDSQVFWKVLSAESFLFYDDISKNLPNSSYFIIGLFILVFIIFKWKKEKKLEDDLAKYGVELEAETKIIGGWGRYSTLYQVEVSFQINSQIVKKRLIIDKGFGGWFPKKGEIRKFPVLVDPFNPQRFLFNVHKFHLTKTSDDSVQNFLERDKAEHPNPKEKS